MKRELKFNSSKEFLDELKNKKHCASSGEKLSVKMPFYVEETGKLCGKDGQRLRVFPLIGAIIGACLGLGITIYTALSWGIISGGKSPIAMPAFVIIVFELAILIGALFAFAGFLLLAGLPDIKAILSDDDFSDDFIITSERTDDDGKQ